MNDWKKDLTKKHNEENPPPTKEVVSLLRIAEDDIDANSFKVRIPYEDLDYLQCETVDILLLLASGIKPKEVCTIVGERYGKEFNIDKVYKAKQNHPAEFCKMLRFYREIFLNQQVQGVQQWTMQILYESMKYVKPDDLSIADRLKLAQAAKIYGDICKDKEGEGGYKPVGVDEMKKLEAKMREITGGK